MTVWSNNNGFTDLESLLGLPKLESLTHSGVGGSLMPLRRTPALRQLTLRTAMRADLTPLQDLAQLEYLDLRGLGTFDLSPLAQHKL